MSASQASFTSAASLMTAQPTATTLFVRGVQGHGNIFVVLEAPIDAQTVSAPHDEVGVYCMQCGTEHTVAQAAFGGEIPRCSTCGSLLGFTQASTSALFHMWLRRFADPRKVIVQRVTRFNPMRAVFVVPVSPITGKQPRPTFINLGQQDAVNSLQAGRHGGQEFHRPTVRRGATGK